MERWMDTRQQGLDEVGQQITIAYFLFNTLGPNHKSAVEIVLHSRDGHGRATRRERKKGEIPRNNEAFQRGISKVQDHSAALLIGCRCHNSVQIQWEKLTGGSQKGLH